MENQNRCWLLSWIPYETKFGCGWASFNPDVHFLSYSPPHHIHVYIQFNIFQGLFTILWHLLLLPISLLLSLLRFSISLSKFVIVFFELHRMVASQMFRTAHVNVCVKECVLIHWFFKIYLFVSEYKPICISSSRFYLSYVVFGLVLLACLRFIRFYCEKQQKKTGKKVCKAAVFPVDGFSFFFFFDSFFVRLKLKWCIRHSTNKRGQTYTT